MFLKKNKFWIFSFLLVLVLFAGLFYFYTKFFPSQTGEWAEKTADLTEKIVPSSGWEASPTDGKENLFWTSLDFPGQQNICLDIYARNDLSINKNFSLPASQTSRVALYPKVESLSNLFTAYPISVVNENLLQDKPYLLCQLENNIKKEDKNIFITTEKEKFLIPTKKIFGNYFPRKSIPEQEEDLSHLDYSNVLVNFPDGVLVSNGQGVFVVSNRKLYLIKSPEIFEALGFQWENVQQMNDFEINLNTLESQNMLGFGSAHPNGIIIKDNGNHYLVWLGKLYQLSEEEKNRCFLFQPQVEVGARDLKASCVANGKKTTCCVNGVDPRLAPPKYFPFANTIAWDIGKITEKENIEKIDWQSKMAVNKENAWRRLGSLKNYFLYTSGIIK